MPAKDHRNSDCQSNPGSSRNATNNALAVLNDTITLRITVIPAIIKSLGIAAAPLSTIIKPAYVACTRPRNAPRPIRIWLSTYRPHSTGNAA